MKPYWHRAIFLLLLTALPLLAVASASMSFCQTNDQQTVHASTANNIETDCFMSCSHEHNQSCELGQGCGSCVAPLADAPSVSYPTSSTTIYSVSFPIRYVSPIVERLERPPMVA